MIELTKKDEFAEIAYQGKILAVVYRQGDGTTAIVPNKSEPVKIEVGGGK